MAKRKRPPDPIFTDRRLAHPIQRDENDGGNGRSAGLSLDIAVLVGVSAVTGDGGCAAGGGCGAHARVRRGRASGGCVGGGADARAPGRRRVVKGGAGRGCAGCGACARASRPGRTVDAGDAGVGLARHLGTSSSVAVEVAPGDHDAGVDAAFESDLKTWDSAGVADDSAVIVKNGPASTEVSMEKCTEDRRTGGVRGRSRFGRWRSGAECRYTGADIPVCDH